MCVFSFVCVRETVFLEGARTTGLTAKNNIKIEIDKNTSHSDKTHIVTKSEPRHQKH